MCGWYILCFGGKYEQMLSESGVFTRKERRWRVRNRGRVEQGILWVVTDGSSRKEGPHSTTTNLDRPPRSEEEGFLESKATDTRTIDHCDIIEADGREAVRVVGWMCGTPQSGDQLSPNLDRLHTDRRIEGRKGP